MLERLVTTADIMQNYPSFVRLWHDLRHDFDLPLPSLDLVVLIHKKLAYATTQLRVHFKTKLKGVAKTQTGVEQLRKKAK